MRLGSDIREENGDPIEEAIKSACHLGRPEEAGEKREIMISLEQELKVDEKHVSEMIFQSRERTAQMMMMITRPDIAAMKVV